MTTAAIGSTGSSCRAKPCNSILSGTERIFCCCFQSTLDQRRKRPCIFLIKMNLFTNVPCLLWILQEKRSYTYREIYTLQEQILSAAPSGSLLFLLCRNHPDCIAVYLGCLRMRLVPLLLDEQVHPDDLSRLESSYGPNFIFLPIERTVEFPEAILLWQDDGFALMQLRAEALPCIRIWRCF